MIISNTTLTKEQLFTLVPEFIARETMIWLRAHERVYIHRDFDTWRCATDTSVIRRYDDKGKFYVVNAAVVYSDKERLLNYINVFKEYPETGDVIRDSRKLNEARLAHKKAVDIDESGNVVWA